MAQKTVVLLEDDMQGGEATETHTFTFDGVTYEIDLNEKNSAKFREALAFYADHGRRVGRRSSSRRSASTDKEQLDAIRQWARKKGYDVAYRGRISQEVRDAYNSRGK